MEEWATYEDFHSDINLMSSFHDEEENSTEIEINKNMILDEDSNNSNDGAAAVGPLPSKTLSTKTPQQSDRRAMDRVIHEVTEDLRQARIVFEDESSFFNKNGKSSSEDEFSSCSSAYYTALDDNLPVKKIEECQKKTVIPKKSKKTKFRPLSNEPTTFVSAQHEEWRPIQDKTLSSRDFPRL